MTNMTNKQTSQTPQIRFKGFTDEWEKKKLGEIGTVSMCKRIFKQQTSETGEIPFYKIGTFGAEPDAYISRALFNEYKSKYSYPKKGDILISASGSIGRSIEYGGKDEYFQDSNIVWLDHDNCIINLFLKYTYCIINWSSVEGSTIKRLYNDIILKTEISLPTLAEQRAIGEYFSRVDELIAQQQAKLDKLKNVKKSCLEKMFPKPGCDVPEVRFKGFTGKWEKKKLGEIATRVIRKNSNLESELPLTISAQYGLVDQITYFNNRVASQNIKNYYLIFNGEFAYNKSSSDGFPFGTIKRLDLYNKGVLSTLYIIFSIKVNAVDSQFLVSYYETNRWHKQISECAAEGARNHGLLNISADDFFDSELTIPNNLSEQRAIGEYLSNLDALIESTGEKLEKLKQLKTACLSKMFV